MQDVMSYLSNIYRPATLMKSARIGVGSYRRDRDLPRLLGMPIPPKNGEAVFQLLDIEHDLDQRRRRKDANYSLIRHVSVMIALIGEAQMLRDNAPLPSLRVIK